MISRFFKALAVAAKNSRFLPVFSAGFFLILIGTFTYSLDQDWSVIDAFYFSVSMATTTGVNNPKLVIEDDWLKLFTALYILVSLGIIVEFARQIGFSFVALRAKEKEEKEKKREQKQNSKAKKSSK